MDYNQLTLKLHEEKQGKIEVISKVRVKTRERVFNTCSLFKIEHNPSHAAK